MRGGFWRATIVKWVFGELARTNRGGITNQILTLGDEVCSSCRKKRLHRWLSKALLQGAWSNSSKGWRLRLSSAGVGGEYPLKNKQQF